MRYLVLWLYTTADMKTVKIARSQTTINNSRTYLWNIISQNSDITNRVWILVAFYGKLERSSQAHIPAETLMIIPSMVLSFRAAVLLATVEARRAHRAGLWVEGGMVRGAGAGAAGRGCAGPAPPRANSLRGGGEPGPPASIYSFNQCECLPLAGVHARVMR